MLRAVKDANELARLAAAGAAADATYERDPRRSASPAARRPTSPPTSPGCCASSATRRSTSPSSAPARTAPTRTTRPATATIEAGDMVVLDFGGLKDGYGSDTSRTVHVGEPSAEEQRGPRRRTRGAAGRASRRSGRASPARRSTGPPAQVITDAGYGDQFIHRTGHGIGVTTHEPPYMIEGEEQPLVPGHVLLRRAGDLSARPLRGPHRGHRRRSPRTAAAGSTTPPARCGSSGSGPRCRTVAQCRNTLPSTARTPSEAAPTDSSTSRQTPDVCPVGAEVADHGEERHREPQRPVGRAAGGHPQQVEQEDGDGGHGTDKDEHLLGRRVGVRR